MAIINPDIGIKLIFILGVTNLVSVIFIFFSCRCLSGSFLNRYKWYPKFFKLHCYFWWIFFGSVLMHAILALLVFGIPF